MACVAIMILITSILFGFTISRIGTIFSQIKERSDDDDENDDHDDDKIIDDNEVDNQLIKLKKCFIRECIMM